MQLQLRMSVGAWQRAARFDGLSEPLLIFAVARIALFILAFVGQVVIPFHTGSNRGPFPNDYFLDGWFRWDAGWYLGIASQGYWRDPHTLGGNIAFFPLYPILIAALQRAIESAPIAALVIANVSFAGAVVFLYRLVEFRFDRAIARRTVILVCAFPFAFFFAAAYTESLFLFLTVLSFYLAERERWWLSGLAGALAALTRSVGGILGPCLFLLYLRKKSYQPTKLDWNIFASGLPPLGSALFMAYLYARFGDPLAFAKASLFAWGRYDVFTAGFDRLNPATWNIGNFDMVLAINFVFAVFWLLLAIPSFRRLGSAYALYLVFAMVVPLSSQTESLGRFVSVVFPGFVVLACSLRDAFYWKLAVAGSAMLLGLFTVLFVNWYWVV